MHSLHKLVHLLQSLKLVGQILAKRKLTEKNFVHKLGNVLAGLPTSESCTLPDTPSHELEWSRREFLACGSDADNSGLTVATVGNFECIPHDTDVACAIEGELNAPLLTLFEPLACWLCHWVVAISSAKLLGNLEFAFVNVQGINASSTTGLGGLDDSEADSAKTPDSHGDTIAEVGVVHDCTPAC